MKKLEEIYAQLKSSFEESSGVMLNDGGDMALRFRALAAQLVSLWAQTEFVSRQCFPQTATGEYLDDHAALRGLTRAGAEKAYGVIRFMIGTVRSDDLTVPEGTVCITDEGTEFVTVAAGHIFAGNRYCDVNAQAAAPGSGGNVPAGSIVHMIAPPTGIEACTNNVAFTGGGDGESDDELRTRVLAGYRSLQNGGNAAYYRSVAMNVGGVAAVNVVPRARGRGTVNVVVASEAGVPSEQLVAEVSAAMEARREICVDVDVSAAAAVNVDVELQVETADGFDGDAVHAAVESALGALCGGANMGHDLLVADIANAVYNTPGVKRYNIVMPTEDIAVDASHVPVLSTVEISGVE